MHNEKKIFIRPQHKRLVQSLFALKPKKKSFLYTLIFVISVGLFSRLAWIIPQFKVFSSASFYEVYKQGEIWKLFTTTFIHADGLHLGSNSYMLFFLSLAVIGYFGWRVFLIYGLSGASLTNAISLATYSPKVHLIGASGLVYFLAGFWLCLYLIIERQRKISARLIRATGLALVILFPTSFEPQTSYRTHAIGFIIGLVFALIYYFKNNVYIHAFDQYEIINEDDEGLSLED